MSLPDWSRAHGAPLCTCRIRSQPQDFVVDEILEIDFSGDGEHDWLRVRKTGANTAWVAAALARHAGVREPDVGYAGLKDRHAVTTQWFSVRRPGRDGSDWTAFDAAGVDILDVQRHARKLKRGAHRGNAFEIVLRDPEPAPDPRLLDERMNTIATRGVPNYFGEQRFGRDGANVALGEAVIAGRRLSRSKRSIGISALRSFAFNEELGERVSDGSWNQLLPGDVANLDGSNSVFDVTDVDDHLERRCRELDIHPTGTLPAIESIGVKPARRALRMRVKDLAWEHDGERVRLAFRLDSGSFATAVLREVAGWSQGSRSRT